MNKVYYLAYYDFTGSNEKRNVALSAKTKTDYIIDCLTKLGLRVEIISASGSSSRTTGYPKSYTKIKENVYLKKFSTFPWDSGLHKLLNLIVSRVKVFLELLKKNNNDIIIVYHSLGYMKTVSFAHKLKKFKLVMEVEEIYADVTGIQKTKKAELRFFQEADAYIFPSQLLDKLINNKQKPSVICHGTYSVETDIGDRLFEKFSQKENKRIVHCVYAGTLDPRKGGALAATGAAAYLPSTYHMHILGFGSNDEVDDAKNNIEEISKRSKAKVSYDGCLSGDDYIRFIQSCDIGLSTQNPDAAFNATSFPSKVLSYLANGLHVVSIRIPVVEQSAVGDLLTYYDNQTPEEIAKAIISVDINSLHDNRNIITTLSDSFEKDLKSLLLEILERKISP